MTVKEKFEEIRARAIQLSEEGVCVLWGNTENALEIGWTLETGEDFVKASGLAHMINEWDDAPEVNDNCAIHSQCEDTTEGWQEWKINVDCVWL